MVTSVETDDLKPANYTKVLLPFCVLDQLEQCSFLLLTESEFALKYYISYFKFLGLITIAITTVFAFVLAYIGLS